MQMTQLINKLSRTDAKLIGRDRFLIFMFIFVVYIAGALRFLLPWANDYLTESGILPNTTITENLADFYPMIVAYMAIFTGGLLIGLVVGFILLDEKDQNTLKVMLVSPLPLRQYVLYRIGLPTILAFVVILAMVLVINQATLPLWQMILIAAGGALSAPIAALFFAVFAENKVAGFAYGKFVGLAGWIIAGSWFVSEPFQWLFGIFPPFWVSKAYWLALEGRSIWWLSLIIGVALQLAPINWLIRRFNKVAYAT
jgi:fluoroquinolone transport system permease protein